MAHIVDSAFDRSRVVLLALFVLVLMGANAFQTLPREADPDVPIPIVAITIPLPGVSPEDAERLLAKPSETELQPLEGLEEMDSLTYEGAAQIILEFEATADMDEVLIDVREAMDKARGEFPAETREPVIAEFNAQRQFPIVSVVLSGTAPERALFNFAQDLKDKILGVPGVLDAELSGSRDELLEVIVDPDTLENYGISEMEIAQAIRNNNTLITAGSVNFEDGAYAVKLPGLIKSTDEALAIPIRTDGSNVITLGDIASLRRTFEDRSGYALLNGQTSIGINVNKRGGANIVQLTEKIKALTTAETQTWPSTIDVTFIGDQSVQVNDILSSLTASIILAIILVMILVVAALGFRSAMLVGFAIPSSFLLGMVLLSMSGYSFNMMTMFSMVLAVGMLVDSAIVVVEYADRRMLEGETRVDAYRTAAKRMFWPITASTATTLAAFVPFLFWKDQMGEFMKFIPITLIFVLSSSLLVALIFLPLVGSYARVPSFFKKLGMKGKTDQPAIVDLDNVDPRTLNNVTGAYARMISYLTLRPVRSVIVATLVIVFCFLTFTKSETDVLLFPDVDDERVNIIVQARGNLSAKEELDIVQEVEATIAAHPAVENLYTQTGPAISRQRSIPAEAIGTIAVDLVDYTEREISFAVMDEFRLLTAAVPGVIVEVRQEDAGPPVGKDVQVEITAPQFEDSLKAVQLARKFMEESTTTVNGRTVRTFMDIEDNQPLPGIEQRITVDRELAGQYGVSVAEIGSMLQLVTDGLMIDKYRPDDADEEIDIRIRFPKEDRTLTALSSLRIQTRDGALPVSNFIKTEAVSQVDRVVRRDGRRVMDLLANGNTSIKGHEVSQSDAITVMADWLASGELESAFGEKTVSARMVGTTEEQDSASSFFVGAMIAAMFMIGVILLLQFNSFYHAALTLSAVVLSVIGVLFGIAISGQYIAVITTGVGIVALAGIVVNNNIVLIDTFQHLRRLGLPVEEAVVRTAAQRVRPVLLTTITTIMGLLPMVFEVSVNFIEGTIGIGSSTSGWWVLLSSAIVFGLAFSTFLTLILTPVMLGFPTIFGQQLYIYKNVVLNFLGLNSTGRRHRHALDQASDSDLTEDDFQRAAE